MINLTRSNFTLDARALLLARFLLGLICLSDAVVRCYSYQQLLGPNALFPMSLVPVWANGLAWHLSPFVWGGGGVAVFCLVLYLLASGAMMAGVGGRWPIAICYAMVWGLHLRAPVLDDCGDQLLRCLLLALLLVAGPDLGGWLSKRYASQVSGAASVFVVSQVAIVYIATSILKSDPSWLDGFGVARVLSCPHVATASGLIVGALPGLPWLLGVLVRPLELLGGLCLLYRPWRSVGLMALGLLHLGMACFLDVGPFPYISAAGLALLLPASFFDTLRWRSLGRPVTDSPIVDVAALSCLFLMVSWNVEGLLKFNVLPYGLRWAALTSGLSQRWDMFAPESSSSDGWPVVAMRWRGRDFDAWGGGTVDLSRVPSGASLYPSEHWRMAWYDIAYFRPSDAYWAARYYQRQYPGCEIVAVWWVGRPNAQTPYKPRLLWRLVDEKKTPAK